MGRRSADRCGEIGLRCRLLPVFLRKISGEGREGRGERGKRERGRGGEGERGEAEKERRRAGREKYQERGEGRTYQSCSYHIDSASTHTILSLALLDSPRSTEVLSMSCHCLIYCSLLSLSLIYLDLLSPHLPLPSPQWIL